MTGWRLFDYYQWLLDKIDGHKEPYFNYSLLLAELHAIPFSSGIALDQNRIADAERLRFVYLDEMLIPDLFYFDGVRCSVLEVMVGLSMRYDNEFAMGDGRGAAFLFWKMIENLGLLPFNDENYQGAYVKQQISRWVQREFSRNGIGSPFPLRASHSDQRKLDLWLQMCGYLSENM